MMRRKKDWSSFLRYVVFPPTLKNGPVAESSLSALLVASSTSRKEYTQDVEEGFFFFGGNVK